jgi:hypothetical protein
MNDMAKHRAIKITLELLLSEHADTTEVLHQLQLFLLDTYEIDDNDWCPFDADAIVMELTDDKLAYIDSEEKQLPSRRLDLGDA